jgi:hypothetical protein
MVFFGGERTRRQPSAILSAAATVCRSKTTWWVPCAVGMAAAIAFLLFSWLSLAVPRETIAARVGNKAGVLLNGRAPLNIPMLNAAGLRHAGFFSSNDCLIYGMMVLAYPNRIAEIVSPKIVGMTPALARIATDDTPYTCIGLVHYVDGSLSEHEVSPIYYHRYVAAYRPAMRFIAWLFPLSVGALVLFGFNVSILIVLGGAAGWRMRKATEDAERRRQRAFAVIAAFFLLAFGLQVYGQCPSYALADMVDFLFLFAARRWPLCQLSERRFLVLIACFGAATAGFEFLTGGIPLGMALILGMTALGRPSDHTVLARRAVLGVLAYVLSIAACIVAHYFAVVGVFGIGEVGNYVQALGTRLGTGFTGELTPSQLDKSRVFGIFDLKTIERSRLLATAFLPVRLFWNSRILSWGFLPAAAILNIASLVIIGRRLSRGYRQASPLEKTMRGVWAGSVLVILLWYVLFLNHSILHPWMVRLFTWFYALAGILIFAPPRNTDS